MMSITQDFAKLRASILAQEGKSFPFPAISKQVSLIVSFMILQLSQQLWKLCITPELQKVPRMPFTSQ
jgi:hypothetical protein